MKYVLEKQEIIKEEIEVSPCPFCSREEVAVQYYAGEWGYRPAEAYVECTCGAVGPKVVSSELSRIEGQRQAIKLWNRRIGNKES